MGWNGMGSEHFVFPDLPENTTPPIPKYVCDCVHVRDIYCTVLIYVHIEYIYTSFISSKDIMQTLYII